MKTFRRGHCLLAGFALSMLLMTGCSPYAPLKASPSAEYLFEHRSLASILEEHQGVLHGPEDGVMSFNPLAEDEPYRTRAQWTGKTRMIPEMRWDMVQIWGRFFRIPVSFTRQYTQEIQVVDQQATLWLPATAEQLAVLRRQPPDSEVTLWMMLLGAVKESEQFDYLFLINRLEAGKLE